MNEAISYKDFFILFLNCREIENGCTIERDIFSIRPLLEIPIPIPRKETKRERKKKATLGDWGITLNRNASSALRHLELKFYWNPWK